MKVVQLIQGSERWKDWRALSIGGSEAPIIAGASEYATAHQLYLRRTNREEREPQNFAMRRGLRMEPRARQLHHKLTGIRTEPCCLEHDHLTWLHASLDGMDFNGELILEVKCPNLACHQEALAGVVPAGWIAQVMHELMVSGAQRAHYASFSEHRIFDEADQLAVIEVLPDQEYFQRLLFLEGCFWAALEADYWPEGGLPKVSLPAIAGRLLFPNREKPTITTARSA